MRLLKYILFFLPFIICFDGFAQAKDTLANSDEMPPKKIITDSTRVFEYVDKFPTFPGGMSAYEKYIVENVKYPKYASTRGIEGVVYLGMIIDEEGNISNVKVLKTPHASLGEESLRVVKNMPNWEPGEMNGKPVKVRTTIRIKFTLRDSEPVKKDNGAWIEKK